MKRVSLCLALLCVCLFALPAAAQNAAFNGTCFQGGIKATVSGLGSTNYLDGIIPACSVTVYFTGTTTKATIFSSASGHALANPFTASVLGSAAPGQWVFFAAPAVGYDVVLSGGNSNPNCTTAPLCYTQPVTLTDLIVPSGGSGPTGTCGPLDSDGTSTNCGNGNFTAYTGTTGQAFGYTNIGTVNAKNVVAVGANNLASVTAIGNGHSIIGIGNGNTTGITNTNGGADNLIGIGYQSLTTVDGRDIIAIGHQSGRNIPSTGTSEGSGQVSADDIIVGDGSGDGWTAPAFDVIAIGNGAGDGYNGVGTQEVVAIGTGAGSHNSLGVTIAPNDLVAIGNGAGAEYGGTEGVFLGDAGGFYLSPSADNVSIGAGTGFGPRASSGAPTSTVSNAVAIGTSSGVFNIGSETVAIGDHTLYCTTDCNVGFSEVGNSGVDNIAIGDHALPANTTGIGNIAIGYYAGGNGWTKTGLSDPVIANSNQTGSHNTWLGYGTGPNTATQLSNTIALGYNAQVSASNQTVIGNSSITSLKIFGCPSGQSVLDDGSGTCYVPGSSSFITSLTTTGTSGPATVISGVLNIPQYSGGGGGSFSAITTGTNSGQTLVVGATSTLAPASTGTIQANIITGTIVAGTNIAISGSGTVVSPYSISASGTGIGGSGTANTMAKFTASATIGNSLLGDDGTTLTYSGTGGLSLTGTSHFITIAEQAAPANPSSGSQRWYADSTTHLLTCITSSGGNCAPSGGGSGFPITLGSTSIASSSTTTTLTGFASIGSAVFAGTGSTQTVVNLSQGTAAASPPANSIQFGAPTSVTSSYTAFLPTLAPTDAGGDVWVVPSGGGTGTWQAYGSATCGSGNIPCTNTTNTFTAEQTLNVTSTTGATLKLKTTSTSSVVGIDLLSQGGKEWQLVGGGTLFAANCMYINDATDSNSIAHAWCNSGTPLEQVRSDSIVGWSHTTNATDSMDTAFSRASAGLLALGNGTAGNASASLSLLSINPHVYTVSTLPSASSFGAGTMVMVSDASTFTPGTCTGGGSDYMIAVTNGTAWSCH